MGTSRTWKSSQGDALFEVTFTFNPRVAVDYFLRVDGFWRHWWTFVLTACWLVFGATLQLSLSAYFPEFPLYPAPLIVSYLGWCRSPYGGVFCAILEGILLDSLLFGSLGTSSVIMFFVFLWTYHWRQRISGDGHLGFCGMCLGGGSIMIYVLGKLLLLGFSAGGNAVVSAVFWQLLVGTVLGGVCLAPLVYWLLDGIERLLRVTSKREVDHG